MLTDLEERTLFFQPSLFPLKQAPDVPLKTFLKKLLEERSKCEQLSQRQEQEMIQAIRSLVFFCCPSSAFGLQVWEERKGRKKLPDGRKHTASNAGPTLGRCTGEKNFAAIHSMLPLHFAL